MGCANGNTIHTPLNKTENKSKKGFKISSTKDLDTIEKKVTKAIYSKEGQKFLKLAEISSKEKEVEFKNLLITSNTYYDLLSALNHNLNLESFIMTNVEVEGMIKSLTYRTY